MADKEVRLFGMWASPFTKRVEWALKLKGIEYEYMNENIPFSTSEELLRLNPVTKKIPVLVHNGKPLAESLVIIEYIDETWKEGYSIMPKDPYDLAQARFWAKFADDKGTMSLLHVFSKEGEVQQKAVEEAREVFKTLEQALEGKKFFGGDCINYLDLAIGWYAFWLPIIEETANVSMVDDANAPLLKAWFGRFLEVDVIKSILPPRDKTSEMSKIRRNQLLSNMP
ncbi:Glutathione S-transferase family protein [Rhynchospora pubera]|uniref:glutathione transferase n=1 Tax=Rhynchospora pubera TaxID=906938 RepID=A0AAV8GD58_9POAL|nr:Glutathione S-transferase family protein [Rhynchospora pubera]